MKNAAGKSVVTIMVAIAIVALFLRFTIEKIIRININQNEINAQATLKLISAGLENYAHDHLGSFPADSSVLTQDNPPYLDKDYIARSPVRGYIYSCLRLEPSGYSCSAVPYKCELSGTTKYTVSTGGLFMSEKCDKE